LTHPRPETARAWLKGHWNLLLLLLATAIYLVSLAVNFSRILKALYWDSDVTFLPLLTEDLPSLGEAGKVNTGNNPYFNTLWLLMAASRLPFYSLLLDVGPYLAYLVTVGLTTWAARKAAGRWAAAVTAALLIGVSAPVLVTVIVPGFRITTWFAGAATLAYLIWLVSRNSDKVGSPLLAVGALVTVLAGTTLASDTLFLASGLLPFAGAAVYIWLTDRSPRGWWTIGVSAAVTVASLAIAAWTAWWMHSLGFRATYPSVGFWFATEKQFWGNLGQIIQAVLAMGNGTFFGRPLGRSALAAAVAAAVTSASVVVSGAAVRRTLWGPVHAVRSVSQSSPGTLESARPRAQLGAWVAYWALAGTGVTACLLLSNISSGIGVDSTRYAVPIFFSIAALVPVWAGNSTFRRGSVAVLAAFLILVSARGHRAIYAGTEDVPLVEQAPALLNFLEQQGLDRGYAGYWNAHALTWNSNLKVRVYPVFECQQPANNQLCTFPIAARDSWYRPQQGRSFVLTGPERGQALSDVPSSELGPPQLVEKVGKLTVYVYAYDVAARFTPRELFGGP
jgi:hypothetical protein